MAAQLELKVASLNDDKFKFVPTSLTVKIGAVNSDMQTVDVYFELKDNGEFDTAIYTGLERIQRGNMNIPLSLVALLVNEDGNYNIPVINKALESSFLSVAEDKNV